MEKKAKKKIIQTIAARKLNRQTWKLIAVIDLCVTAFVVVLNLFVRVKMGLVLTPENAWHETLPVLPMIPVTALFLFGAFKYSNKQQLLLCDSLEKVSEGNLDTRIEIKGTGPYAKAFEDFNIMCQKLETTNKELEETLAVANKANAAKTDFLFNMSHEIRTPINTVLGFNEMVIRETKEDKIRNYAQDIKGAGKTLMTLVDDVLDTSKIEVGKYDIVPEKYDLASFVNDIRNMTLLRANDKGLKFELKVDEKIPHMLKGDDGRIKQCVLNLLSNAVKFTDEGNVKLEIGFSKLTGDDIILSIAVSDTGCGFNQNDIERMFTPFEKLNGNAKDGAGLGLSVTRSILSLMDSELRVESKLGQGSTFSFLIRQGVIDWEPIGDIKEAGIKCHEAEEKYKVLFQAPDAKILVVDDSSVNLTIVEGLLKDTKVLLTLSESGKDAVSLSKEHQYDLILLDHMMPEMDGVETLHHIREDEGSQNRNTKIVALTANAVPGAKESYEAEGFDGYLSKPIEAALLEKSIKDLLNPELIQEPKEEKIEPDVETKPAIVEDNQNSVTEETQPLVTEDAKPVDSQSTDNKDGENKDDFLSKISKVKNIFPDKGIEYSGSEALYQKVVGEFVDTGISRAAIIEQYYEQQDYKNYTIQVHALKSAARIIGATKLSQLAMALEEAGNEQNSTKIENATGELLRLYREVVEDLSMIIETKKDLIAIDEDGLKDAFLTIREMAEGFDFDGIDSVMEELKKYEIPDNFKEKYQKLKTLVAEVARDDILLLIDDK